ncbi:MAG: zinc-dependent metalloprotease [Candidatus Cryptobacteroides sp.]|nr:zinc-dependent metalloprotease [Candidatus Cryptobacteroides sp.]
MTRCKLLLNTVLALSSISFSASAAAVADSTSKAGGKYEKTFVKDPSCVSYSNADGFVKFHKVSGKLYMELSDRAIGKRMLMASTVTAVSDPEVLPVGYKPTKPLYVRFERPDSLVINLCEITLLPDYDKTDSALSAAVRRTTLDTVLETFPLYCESPDGDAAVFDVTSFFGGGNEKLGPVKSGTSNYISTKFSLKKASDLVTGVKVFEDNAAVTSSHTYTINSDVLGLVSLKKDEPFTVTTTRTILMLPDDIMASRKADSRIGIFLTDRRLLRDGEEIDKYSVINRWRIEPSDTAAYLGGECVEPEEHIVFYIDDAFPSKWKDAAVRGVLRWNSAFEDIGFKDVIQVRDFPDDDPEFDPDNLKYSCIRYVPSTVANAMGPSWVDPVSGEIINASVIVYNDVVSLAGGWRFCQTAQLDPRARLAQMPQDLLEETIEYVLAHEVGHCLGFMHNMAASAAWPTDSLRSPSFTRANGTTASIMDYARFNYVAQPEDIGVSLDPPYLGPYDRFLVKYAYSFIPEDADSVVERWVDEKAGDPVYRYGRQQVKARYDPSAIEEDLGNDPVRSSEYGISNLKYIIAHNGEWADDATDPDGKLRRERYKLIVKQMGRYLSAVAANVGGIYLNQVKSGVSSLEPAVAVPAGVQKESLEWVLDNLLDMDWLSAEAASCPRILAVDEADILVFNTASDLFSTWENVIISSYMARDDIFTLVDWLKTIDSVIWRGDLTPDRMTIQKIYVNSLVSAASRKTSISKLSLLSDDLSSGSLPADDSFGPAGYSWQTKVNIKPVNNAKELFSFELCELQNRLKKLLRSAKNEVAKAHYLSLIDAIESEAQ